MKASTKEAIGMVAVAAVLAAVTGLALWYEWHKVGLVLLILTALVVGGLGQWLRSAMWRASLKRR